MSVMILCSKGLSRSEGTVIAPQETACIEIPPLKAKHCWESNGHRQDQVQVSAASGRGSMQLRQEGRRGLGREDRHGTQAEAVAAAAPVDLSLEADRLLVLHTAGNETAGASDRRGRERCDLALAGHFTGNYPEVLAARAPPADNACPGPGQCAPIDRIDPIACGGTPLIDPLGNRFLHVAVNSVSAGDSPTNRFRGVSARGSSGATKRPFFSETTASTPRAAQPHETPA